MEIENVLFVITFAIVEKLTAIKIEILQEFYKTLLATICQLNKGITEEWLGLNNSLKIEHVEITRSHFVVLLKAGQETVVLK